MTEVLATVRDTVDPARMDPADTSYQGVLAYRDGPFRWFPAQAERFHHAGKLIYPITVTGNPHAAQVCDCENGDLGIVQAVDWAKRRNDLHGDATIYASRSTIQTSLVHALGNEPCWLWVAWWIGRPTIPNMTLPTHIRIAAIQYDNRETAGYDLSAIVSREWPASPYADMQHW